MTTAVFMLGIAVIAIENIKFLLVDILLLPLIIGTSFGYGFGLFMKEFFHLPLADVIIWISAWFLELFWMYLWARLVVKIILSFRLKSKID